MVTLKPQDIKRLSLNLVLCLALLGLGGGTVLVAVRQEAAAKQALQQAAAQQKEAVARLAQARDEAQEILTKTQTYQDLVGRGIVGQEHRLEWVELLKNIRQERRLIDLQYEISPQKLLDGESPAPVGGYEMMNSAMSAQLQLLHEGDLLRFVDDLSRRAQAQIRVRHCALARLPGQPPGPGPAPQLSARCELDWITLREHP